MPLGRPFSSTFIIGPRLGKKSAAALESRRPTHIWTLLGPNEDAAKQAEFAAALSAQWIWTPIESGSTDYLAGLDLAKMTDAFFAAAKADAELLVYLHCSAGIHRTGFIAAALMRILDARSAEEIHEELTRMRPATGDGVGRERIELAVTMADAMLAKAVDRPS